MRRLLIVLSIIAFVVPANAQNEPELVASFVSQATARRLVYIDHGLPKLIIQTNEEFELYNTDFTLFSTILISEADTNSFTRGLFTRSLFDCDTTNVEYLSAGQFGNQNYTRVYRDDGTILWEVNGQIPVNILPTYENEFGIVSNSEGSYMILGNNAFGSNQYLYHLCGQMPQPLPRESDGTLINGIIPHGGNSGFSAYPNPANETVQFEYDLQGHKKANLQLFNTSGQLMKEMMLGQAFDFIRLNIADLEQGTYVARITTDDGFQLSEKFVKVD